MYGFMPSYIITRGPRTAMSALIKKKKQAKLIDIFMCVKSYSKLGQFYGKPHAVRWRFQLKSQKTANFQTVCCLIKLNVT